MDAVGSAIRVDARGREVMRILPRVNEEVNEEWISDKTRYIWRRPAARSASTGPMSARTASLRPATWREAFARDRRQASRRRAGERIGAIAGDLAAVEEMFALEAADAGARRRRTSTAARTARRSIRRSAAPAISSTRPSPASRRPTRILIVGANPRFEAPVLNARIRKRWLRGDAADRRDRRAAPT